LRMIFHDRTKMRVISYAPARCEPVAATHIKGVA
jgi:hypothetical protein